MAGGILSVLCFSCVNKKEDNMKKTAFVLAALLAVSANAMAAEETGGAAGAGASGAAAGQPDRRLRLPRLRPGRDRTLLMKFEQADRL